MISNNSWFYSQGSSTWTIAETAKNSKKKPLENNNDIEKQYANGTSKIDVLSKLKDLCYYSEYVKVARGYCHTKKKGKYYCNKKWKCFRKKQFCRGSVHHTCVYSKSEDGTGKETNVTINILLEKQNKTKEEPKKKGERNNTFSIDESHEHDESGSMESQDINAASKVHFWLIGLIGLVITLS